MSTAIDHALALSVFPTESPAFKPLFSFYDANRPIAISLIAMVLMVRTMYLLISASASDSYFEILRDVFITFIVLIGFSAFIRLSTELPNLIVDHLKVLHQETINLAAEKSVFTSTIIEWSDWITFIVTVLTAILYFFCIGFACIFGPFIIIFSFMLNQKWMIGILVTSLLVMSLWPVAWYIINLVIIHIANQDSAWMNILALALGTGTKLVAPLGILKMLAQKTGISNAAQTAGVGMTGIRSGASLASSASGKAIRSFGGGPALDQVSGGIKKASSGISKGVSSQAKKVIPGAAGLAIGAAVIGGKATKAVAQKIGGSIASGINKVASESVQSKMKSGSSTIQGGMQAAAQKTMGGLKSASSFFTSQKNPYNSKKILPNSSTASQFADKLKSQIGLRKSATPGVTASVQSEKNLSASQKFAPTGKIDSSSSKMVQAGGLVNSQGQTKTAMQVPGQVLQGQPGQNSSPKNSANKYQSSINPKPVEEIQK